MARAPRIRASSTCWSLRRGRRQLTWSPRSPAQLAISWGAIARPRDRDVHAVAIPRMGGVALFAGFALALFVAQPAADPARRRSTTVPRSAVDRASRPALICAIGVLDDQLRTRLADQARRPGAGHRHHGHARRRPARLHLRAVGRHGTVMLGRDVGDPGHDPAHRADHQRGQLHRRPGRAGRRRDRDRRASRSSCSATTSAQSHFAARRGGRRRCSAPPWPAPASGSCRTTSSRPGSSWATRARCWSGSCSRRPRPRRRPTPTRRASADARSTRCRCTCRCCSRWPCWRSRSSTWCSRSSAGSHAAVAVRARQAAPAPPACSSSATATAVRCCCCTSGRRCCPSAAPRSSIFARAAGAAAHRAVGAGPGRPAARRPDRLAVRRAGAGRRARTGPASRELAGGARRRPTAAPRHRCGPCVAAARSGRRTRRATVVPTDGSSWSPSDRPA